MSDPIAANNDNGNGRITIAVLGEKLETLQCDFRELNDLLRKHIEQADDRDRRIVVLETKMLDLDKLKSALIGSALAMIGFLVTVVVILLRVRIP